MRSRAGRRVTPAAVALAMLAVLTGCQLVYTPGTARPYYCDPTDTAVNDGHGGTFETVYTTPKGPLSADDCRALESQLASAQSWVLQNASTVAAAEAAGFVQAAVWESGQGYHYVDPGRTTGPFDPTRPNWLMFEGTGPTARVTGMMFLVQSGMMPPAGFPGANDHWHQHHELCVTRANPIFIAGEQLTDAECAALGGVNQMFMDIWMVHVWLPTYDGWQATDIFNRTHPSLS